MSNKEINLKLINMNEVEVETVDWLLYPFIPFGKITILEGDPGEGKTTVMLQIIAKLTKGEPVLPSEEKKQGTYESDISDCRRWSWRYYKAKTFICRSRL